MNVIRKFLLSVTFVASSAAQANCPLAEKVAATSYERANEALFKGWNEAANSAAYFFWYVHDLSDCPLTKTMATHMTKAGLAKGTQPVGPATGPSSKIYVSIPSGSNFASATGTFGKAIFAPEVVVVNGATYKLLMAPSSTAVTKTTIDALLGDAGQTKLNGITVDKEVLMQWKAVPASPAFKPANALPPR
jgi:hypothetical protein